MLPEQAARPGESAPPRDYGGWRRHRGIGLWGLSAAGTLALMAVIAAAVVLAALSPRLLIYAVPPAAVVIGLSLARIKGEPLALITTRRLRWRYASARGYTRYKATVISEHPAGFTLPGVLASTRLLDADDGYGSRYGIVHDQRTGHLTATLRVLPASTWLAERSEADSWIASWGHWLASLGQIPMLRWVTVTIDTAPEPGSALADTVTAALDPGAPAAAREILGQLIQAAPAVAADVDTRVSFTFDPKVSAEPLHNLADATAEAGRLLPGLESALGSCGVSVLSRLTAPEIAGVIRSAFDPAARGEIARIGAQAQAGLSAEDLAWPDAGPFGAEEHPGHYRHDSGISVTWAWLEAPRQAVTADILARLIIPGPFPKRVTMQYRPFPAATATRVLEAEVSAASFRAHYRYRTGRDETARDASDQARARQAAAEEAAGAGVCLMSMFVTVTVTSDDDLPRAVAWTEAAAGASKIRLRRMTYSQAPGFAASLPCGICPAELARRLPR
jgi:hypothetical protein